jgi:hypothetical protein
MAVERSQLDAVNRDAYWQATQAQLRSAQHRGDILSLVSVLLVALLLWRFRSPSDGSATWATAVAVVALMSVVIPQLFVARRKRQISAARGLKCRHCGYTPHDTEISEVGISRECRRCEQPLD